MPTNSYSHAKQFRSNLYSLLKSSTAECDLSCKGTYIDHRDNSSAIDHRMKKTEVPVRSPVHKLYTDWLVVGWVTTSESQLLIVFAF